MKINRGYKVENAMRKWFKGKSHHSDCVDFQTTTSLYEVKSCRLFLKNVNSNHKRRYLVKPHKRIKTTQMGRFFVQLKNHEGLKFHADKENKIPKYIFVVVIGKQKMWRVKSWEHIDLLVHKKKEVNIIRIKDLFNEIWEEG